MCLLVPLLICAADCNSQHAAGIPLTRSGMLLRKYRDEWAFLSGTGVFFVRGNPDRFATFERRRVSITGTVNGLNQLAVQSIVANELSDGEIRALVEQLRTDRWSTPHNDTNPTL